MEQHSAGFIGGGRVARILLSGWGRSPMPALSSVIVADPDAETLKRLGEAFPDIATTTDMAQAAGQDLVFLATHPPATPAALQAVRPALRDGAVLISLAPKFPIAALSQALDGFDRIARMIPNAPSAVGRGFNPVHFGPGLDAHDRAVLRNGFALLGHCPEVPEAHLEAYAILTAMGPTYFWPVLYALDELGESFGLNREQALKGLGEMLAGAVAVMEEGVSQEEAMDMIPVKPLADGAIELRLAALEKLPLLMAKIRP